MSSSVASGIVPFSAFCRAQASHASWLVTHEWYASSHGRYRPRRVLCFFWPHHFDSCVLAAGAGIALLLEPCVV